MSDETPYAGDAGILLLMKGKLTIWSHRVCLRVLFLIFLCCRFQGQGQGKKHTLEQPNILQIYTYLHTAIVLWLHKISCPLLWYTSRLVKIYMLTNLSNTTGVTYYVATAYPSEAPDFTPGLLWGSCWLILCNVL